MVRDFSIEKQKKYMEKEQKKEAKEQKTETKEQNKETKPNLAEKPKETHKSNNPKLSQE